MQNVKPKTVWNVIYNGITLESISDFAKVSVPVIALVGGKQQKEVRDSVKKLSEMNANCRCEIWDKAAHNVPPMFAKRYNNMVCSVVE